jgi:hypothetical protein
LERPGIAYRLESMSLPRLLAAITLSLVLAVGTLACGGDSEGEPTVQPQAPTATSTPPAEPSPTPSPDPTRPPSAPTPAPATPVPAPSQPETGIPAVDAVIEAVLAADPAQLAALIRFTETACTTAFDIGGPPKCFYYTPEPPDGTLVRSFPLLTCELEWHADPMPFLTDLLSRQPQLYAVLDLDLQGPLFNEPYLPTPEYGVVIRSESPNGVLGHLLMIEDGAVVGIDTACGASPDLLLDSKLYLNQFEVILEGPAFIAMRPGAALAPSGAISNVPEVDAIIADLLAGDAAAFAAHFALFDTNCTTAQGLGGPPQCSDFPGSPPDGTPVRAFPYGVCEGAWTTDPEGLADALLANQPGMPRPDPSLPSGSGLQLFGVVAFDPPQPLYANEPGFPVLQYAILVEYAMGTIPRLGVALGVSSGQVVSMSTVCAGPPELALDHYPGYKIILRGPAYQ